jgi:hypothetical protein
MGLLEAALQVYLELEVSFSQALRGTVPFPMQQFPLFWYSTDDIYLEGNLPWFGNLGGKATGDDSRSILSTTSKPYHELILANTITLFDFRIYLFGKQMALLGKMGRVREVLVKAKEFIVGFARGIRESEVSGQQLGLMYL